jgi:dTDP-4-amino-4,6-dideoxygalactose transaminase
MKVANVGGVAARTNVPLLDLQAQYRTIREEIRAVLDEVCEAQRFIMGPAVTDLEKQIAAYSQAAHAIGVSSGTDALLVALMALDIGRGDEVITSPYTFFATGGTIARVGARPIYCDIDPETYNISPLAVERFIANGCERRGGDLVNKRTGGKVRALMPVHLFGQLADMPPLMKIAEKHGLAVIEDAAQAIGAADEKGRRAGSFGTIGCFSFFPSKNLGAFGDGGMCSTQDAEVAKKLRILRVHGGEPKYYHAVIGGNFRLDALQAAVLIVKLKHLDPWTGGRQKNAAWYNRAFADAGLTGKIATPKLVTGYRHVYNQYVLRVPKRDALKDFMQREGIGTEIYYPVPLHAQKCFAYLGYAEGDCPESERAARETLAIPIYPELAEEQMRHVVQTIAKFYS